MPLQMRAHLIFGFRQKAETPTIAGTAGSGANDERAEIPEGAESTGVTAQLIQPGGAPLQVVCFFTGGFQQGVAQARV